VPGLPLSSEQVLRYRARVSHLDRKLPAGSFAEAAWGGLQDSVPRAGLISLHARVERTTADSWADPSLVQIWFRGGADYLVPLADAGVFTLGSYPRDRERAAELERLADDIHRATEGRTLPVREVSRLLGHEGTTGVRFSALTGRVHIRWDASRIWLIPVERPAIDVEDARRELARRFLHWYGPTTRARLATWTGVQPRDAAETWQAIEPELAAVEILGERRFMRAVDVDALERAEPVSGVRLLPFDDPFTKLDRELLVHDETLRAKVLPAGYSRGFIPGAILVDGEIVGAWQRLGRSVTLHPIKTLAASVREALEAEALAFPIAGSSPASVSWA
jgi:Winged helix DNA-binding domain